MRLALAILLLGAAAVYAAGTCDSSCKCSDPSGNSWDLSAINKELTGSDGNYDYKMKLCGATDASACQGRNAAICQWNKNNPSDSYSLGVFGTGGQPVVSLNDASNPGKGPKIAYTNGDQCWTFQGFIDRKVNVHVQCDQPASETFTVVEDASTCTFTITLPSKGNCGSSGGGGAGEGGLSGGWVFIIILCVTVPLYVVLGCVYKSKKQGTTGMESCPNIDFWRELPGLVKDGVKCTMSGFKRGGGSYSEM